MSGTDAGVAGLGILSLLIAAVVVLWAILWFLVPFMLWAVLGRLRSIHNTLIDVKNLNIQVAQQAGHLPQPVLPPAQHTYRVAGFKNKKFKRVSVKASSENEAVEKAMASGIEVDNVMRA